METIKVDVSTFDNILKGDCNLAFIEGKQIRIGEVFRIHEEGTQNRIVYARTKEKKELKKENKKYFFSKVKTSYISIVLFELTGMININGNDLIMSKPVKDLFKNIDNDFTIVLCRHCARVTLVNNRNDVLGEIEIHSIELDPVTNLIVKLIYILKTSKFEKIVETVVKTDITKELKKDS